MTSSIISDISESVFPDKHGIVPNINCGNFIHLRYFKNIIIADSTTKCYFQHRSSNIHHDFYQISDKYHSKYKVLELSYQFNAVLVRLQKSYKKCMSIILQETKRVENSLKTSDYLNCLSMMNLEVDLNYQLAFLRNICENVKAMLKEPWILKSKIIGSEIPVSLRINIKSFFQKYMRVFNTFLNRIIQTSYFIILLGFKNISLNNISNFKEDEFYNLARGLEEFTKLFHHVKSINISYIYKYHCVSNLSYLCCFNSEANLFLSKDLSVLSIINIISKFRSMIMSERIYRFFFTNRDMSKVIKHKYLFILNQESFHKNVDFAELEKIVSCRSDDTLLNSPGNLEETMEILCSTNDYDKQKSGRKYKKFIQRLSTKMKHSEMNEAMKIEYQFIISLLEHFFSLTDLLQKFQKSEHQKNIIIEEQETHIKGRKGVMWRDTHDIKVKSKVAQFYEDRYWYQVDLYLDNVEAYIFSAQYDRRLRISKHTSKISPSLLHNSSVKVALSKLLKEPSISDEFPDNLKPCLYAQSRKVKYSATVSSFNEAFIYAIGYGHEDRIFTSSTCSNTCQYFLKGIDVVIEGLELNLDNLISSDVIDLLRMSSLLSLAIYNRCSLRFQRIFASWNMVNFIFLLYSDLKLLIDRLNILSEMIKDIKKSDIIEFRRKSQLSVMSFYSNMDKLQTLNSQMNERLLNKIYHDVMMSLLDDFPDASSWSMARKVTNTNESNADYQNNGDGLRKDYNSYVENLIFNIAPIAKSLNFLNMDLQKKIIGDTFEKMMSTFLKFIVEKKLKFSLIGATQLETDMKFIFDWMKQYVCPEIFDHVNKLSIVTKVYGIIEILKRQHDFDRQPVKSKKKDKFNVCTTSKAVRIKEDQIINNSGNYFRLSSINNNKNEINFQEWLDMRAYPMENNVVKLNACM